MSDDMNAPAIGDVVPPQSAPDLPQASPAMPTQAPPAQPSMWRQVLQGAMAGLAGSAGSLPRSVGDWPAEQRES
jgi:hypothetical protein